MHSLLHRFATKAGEKCGLVVRGRAGRHLVSSAAGGSFLPVMTREDTGYLCGLLLLLAGAAFVVNPLFEHPVYDDWAYAKNVLRFLEEGRLYFVWTQTSFLFQFFVGVVFSKVLGFSFATLHLSTLAFSAMGLAALYALLRQMGQRESESFLLTAAMFCTVFYFHFTFSFMTDVPSLATALAAIAVEYRAQRTRSTWWYLASAMAFTAAVLTRDLIGAAVVGLLIQAGWRRQLNGPRLFLLVPLLVWGAYLGYGPKLIAMPWRQMKTIPPDRIPRGELLSTVLLAYVIVAQLAFQFSPLLLSLLPQAVRRANRLRRPALFLAAAVAVPAILAWLQYDNPTEPDDRLMPYRPGFVSLYGIYNEAPLLGERTPVLGTVPRIAMTGIAVLGCAVLLVSAALVARDSVLWIAGSPRARRLLAQSAVVLAAIGLAPMLLSARSILVRVPALQLLRGSLGDQATWTLWWTSALALAASCVSAAAAIGTHVWARSRALQRPYEPPLPESPVWPVHLFTLASLVFYLISAKFFIRYALVLVPGLYVLLRHGLGRLRPMRTMLIPLMALSLGVGIIWTKDQISFNQARWKAGRWLLGRNVPADWIEGGFEFNGWHLPFGEPGRSQFHRPSQFVPQISIWPRFLLSLDTFAPPGRGRLTYDGRRYRWLALFPYESLLESRTRNVVAWGDTALTLPLPPRR
jgi:hypothetical protein